MPTTGRVTRLLVKAPAGVETVPFALGAVATSFALKPLFGSIRLDNAPGIASPSIWQIATPSFDMQELHPWDVCHGLVRTGLGAAGTPVEFAEPDFQQAWLTGTDASLGLDAARDCGHSDPQDPHYPRNADDLWFHETGFGQFDDALAKLATGPQSAVRVAHLDTGYDPDHATLPQHLNTALQKNFVDAAFPDDATDRSEGLIKNLGHGTGTLSILAGKAVNGAAAVGAAPFVDVVPVRVANSVVLFYNSAIAQAFDYVHGLAANPATAVHVITMSMGGLASQAWADAVNALYDAGVFVVTAAGNNFANLPTRNIVFPARFNRVVAACGVMADETAYADLGLGKMGGNYGPASKMATAIAAFTPNTPWARFGCATTIDHDGAGTSAATPQVAAAAAIWIARNLPALQAYASPWMRVEAVRKALFDSAKARDADHLGRGEIKADAALAQAPARAAQLTRQPLDSASFPLFRLLTGLGAAAIPDATQRMLELEALQLSQSAGIEAILPDPAAAPDSVTPADRERLADALASHPLASQTLRQALGRRPIAPQSATPVVELLTAVQAALTAVQKLDLGLATQPTVPMPRSRRLRIYAYDPAAEARLSTARINQAVLDVVWEDDLKPGPIGDYLEVLDVDPASGCCYAPVDLNNPYLLVQDGLAPSEGNPQFHQQMAYAVAMTTIGYFERALGRVALWAPQKAKTPTGGPEQRFVQRLRIYPHALREANAFYSPERKALLLGYFNALAKDSGDVLPGGLVFSALSHDIIAHETTHALLDGLHRRYIEPTNPDVLAFHEGFADIVALFQHFTMPESLRNQIARTRGDLRSESLLSQLAVQFGNATGRYGALRDAIGTIENGTWAPAKPDPSLYQALFEPHDRGSILVAAVFDAFVQIYADRSADLIRLATGGTGVLPPGQISADLTERLAQETAKVAGQVLSICIRALDYSPPVDITFGDYLRALITADRDLVADDPRGYRIAFIAAFRDRGIYPERVRSLSVDSLVWEEPPLQFKNLCEILRKLNLNWDLRSKREDVFETSSDNAVLMHRWLLNEDYVSDDEFAILGLSRQPGKKRHLGGVSGELRPIEVHSVRPARRIGPDGQQNSELVVEITQTFSIDGGGLFRSGCTLIIDVFASKVKYCIYKRFDNEERLASQTAFAETITDHLRATYVAKAWEGIEPFALLHRHL